MSQAVVDGFCEGIRLLPYQVAGRAWMTERESDKKIGGILADDMGLGKTIQTLTRIVDGRSGKSDAEDGWAATTLWVCYLQHAFITFDLLSELYVPLA
jgi:SNF2 family DNA or RNA helicase